MVDGSDYFGRDRLRVVKVYLTPDSERWFAKLPIKQQDGVHYAVINKELIPVEPNTGRKKGSYHFSDPDIVYASQLNFEDQSITSDPLSGVPHPIDPLTY